MKAKEVANILNDEFGDRSYDDDEKLQVDIIAIVNRMRGFISNEYRHVIAERQSGDKRLTGFGSVGVERQLIQWIGSICDKLKIPYLNVKGFESVLVGEVKKIGDESGLGRYRELIDEGISDQRTLNAVGPMLAMAKSLRELDERRRSY